jgi:hypothetical protein
MVKTMARCQTVLLSARKLARSARENRNYACSPQLAAATGESPANDPCPIGAGRYLQPEAD